MFIATLAIELCRASVSFFLSVFCYQLVTGDKLELTYLFQRLPIAIQRGNELCFNGTFVPR